MPRINVDRHSLETVDRLHVDLVPLESGFVMQTIKAPGVRVTILWEPAEADMMGLGFIKCALSARQKPSNLKLVGAPVEHAKDGS
jgi:hypothetical protein